MISARLRINLHKIDISTIVRTKTAGAKTSGRFCFSFIRRGKRIRFTNLASKNAGLILE